DREQRRQIAERGGDDRPERAVGGEGEQRQARRKDQPDRREDRQAAPDHRLAGQQDRREQQEQQRESRYANGGARQRLHGPQAELGGHHARAEKGRGRKGKQNGCGHAFRLAGRLKPISSPLASALPIPSRRSSTPAAPQLGRNEDRTWRPTNCCFSPATASAPR